MGVEMIRTVWLAAICLAGLGGLCASKVTASISPPGDGATDPAVVSATVIPDTLTPADQVDLTGLRPTAEITLAQSTDPLVVRPIRTGRPPSRGLRRQINTRATLVAALPKPRAKSRISKNDKFPRLAGELKKCPETSGLGALIMSLTGTSHCS
jgi:hypothetical protein